MLDISKALTSGKVKSYYREQYSAASGNYYSQGGELKGRWHGFMVDTFGLSNPVTSEAFDRLAEGQHPQTGEQLVKHRTPAPEQTPEPWLNDAAAWWSHLQEKYVADAANWDSVLSGVAALPEPPAVQRELGTIGPREYTDFQRKLIEMHEIAGRIYRENLTGEGGETARAYLAGRGISPELAAEFGLGVSIGRTKQLVKALEHYGPELMKASGIFWEREDGQLLDRWQDRLMIPIQDAEGNTIAFAGRDLTDRARAKYMNSPATELYKKSEVLFNAHRACTKAYEDGRVVAVEGYMDAIAAHSAGVPAVAVGSAIVTREQAAQLGSMAQEVILNFDTDKRNAQGKRAGEEGARLSLDTLMESGVQARVLFFGAPEGVKVDPADMINKYGAEYYRLAVEARSQSGIEWVTQYERDSVVGKVTIEGKTQDWPFDQAKAIKNIVDFLEKAPEPIREDVSRRLSAFMGVEMPAAEQKPEKKKALGHRAGHDLTFNAPKTWSVTAIVGGDERVREAHQFAVKTALDAGQAYAQARLGGSKPAENTAKWIAALFDHDTARPVGGYPAPHMHTHTVVFNMSECEDGKIRSMQPYEIFRMQSLMKAAYQSQGAWYLRRSGYELEQGKNGAQDISGYTLEYLDHESLRHEEIQGEKKRLGLNGRTAESNIAHQKRESKLNYTPDQMREIHRQHAQEHGNQPDMVIAASRARGFRPEPEAKQNERAQAAVSFARASLSERKAVFDEFEILRDALRFDRGHVHIDRLNAEIQSQIEAGQFTEVSHVRRLAPGHRFTTPEAIRAEREMIAAVMEKRGTVAPMAIDKETIRQKYAHLNDDQKWLVYETATATDQIIGVQGSAGTGKTTAMKAMREIAEENGYLVHGLGPTAKARRGVVDAGIESETVARYLHKRGGRAALGANPVLFIVDEASLIATHDMREFFATLQPQDRVYLSGDRKQHQSIGAGLAFEQLQDAGMNVFHLRKIVRQRDESLRKTVALLRDGKIREAVQLLESHGRLRQIQHRSHRLHAMARNYAENPEGALVVVPDNATRQELNRIIREKMRELGKLGEDAMEINVLIPRGNITNAEKLQATFYQPGDALRFRKASAVYGIDAGAYGDVIARDAEKNEVTVRLRNGREVTYDPSRYSGVEMFEQLKKSFGVGDRIQFTRNWYAKGVSTRDMATITYVDSSGNVRAVIDDQGKTISWNLRQNAHVDYGYTMTSTSSQGATVDRVLVHIEAGDSKNRALIGQTLAYVALSRPRYEAQVFTDSKEDLEKAISRMHRNATALAQEQTAAYKENRDMAMGA